MIRHARSVLLLSAFAAPMLMANRGNLWGSDESAPPAANAVAAKPTLIADPFAPKALRPLSPLEAETWNERVPLTDAAIAPAKPFAMGSGDATSMSRSLQCMTAAIYYEAGNEPVDGQRAVAQVILNRMRNPVYPHSVCGVVYQGSERKTGCQFTFTCDGSLSRVPSAQGWARASAVAAAALSGYVYAPVGWATNYHADYVVPYWAQGLEKLATIGHHIFYRWNGRAGTAASFTSRYAGLEPDVALRTAMAAAEPGAGGLPSDGGIVQISSAERPMIAIAEAGAPAATGPDKALAKAAAPPSPEQAHPVVALGSRWIIGGVSRGTRPLQAATAPIEDAQVK